MELPRIGDYRYKLESVGAPGHRHWCVLQIHQPLEQEKPPRFANFFELAGVFSTTQSAYLAAQDLVQRIDAGQAQQVSEKQKKQVRDYVVYGRAAFRLDVKQWQPIGEIVSQKEKNKGSKQAIGEAGTALTHNCYETPARAASAAVEFGERMVLGIVGGLQI